MRRRDLLGVLLTGLSSACAPESPATSTPKARQPREELAALGARYEALMQKHGEAEWGRYAGKLAEGPAAQQRMRQLRNAEQEIFREAGAILKRFGDGVTTPRRADLWQRGALGLKLLGDARSVELSDELEGLINGHRYMLDGRRVSRGQMHEMSRSSDRATRRNVRRLENALHVKAAPIARELFERRRALAKELELPSFHVALLEVRGTSAPDTWRVVDALHVRTARSYFELVKQLRGVSEGALEPWDFDYALEKLVSPPEERFDPGHAFSRVFEIYRAFGIDLEKNGPSLSVRDFAFGGQTIAVRVPDDVRMIVRSIPGMRFYGLLLHELGHAFSVRATRETDPLFKGYEWVPGLLDPAYAEGIAEVFGRLLDEPEILGGHLGLSASEITRAVKARRTSTLVSIRRGFAAAHFEHIALEQPNVDLDKLSLGIERQETGLPLPRDAEPVWATSPFFATYPVYTQSYLFASAMAVQVRQALKARFGARWISPAAGEHLKQELCADGSRWTLREKLIRATGSALDPEPLIRWANTP